MNNMDGWADGMFEVNKLMPPIKEQSFPLWEAY
jgi:hypothetical protein